MTQEVSRTAHLRLRNSTILTLYKLTEIQSGIVDIPMSTMIVNILDNLVDKLLDAGKLPHVTDEAAGSLLDAIYRDKEDTADEELDDIEPDLLGDFISDVEVDSSDIEENLSLHSIPLEKDFQKRSPDEQQLVEGVINYPPNPPWYKQPSENSYPQLMFRAPKDMLIEAAENNEHLQRAIEQIYPVLPQDMWGGSKAQSLVAEVMPMVIHYLGPIPEPDESQGESNGTS